MILRFFIRPLRCKKQRRQQNCNNVNGSQVFAFSFRSFRLCILLKKAGADAEALPRQPLRGVLFLHYNGKRAENFSKFCIVRLHNLAVNINSYIKTVFVVRTSVDIENVVIILAILGLDVKC